MNKQVNNYRYSRNVKNDIIEDFVPVILKTDKNGPVSRKYNLLIINKNGFKLRSAIIFKEIE